MAAEAVRSPEEIGRMLSEAAGQRRYQIETNRAWAREQITWAPREHLPAEERQMKRLVQDCDILLEEMTLIEWARADQRQEVRIQQERRRASR